jgi:Uma2 family endonuclease
MSTAAQQSILTPEDLLSLPDGDRYELVDGQLVERNLSTWSSYVAGRVYRLVANFTEPKHAGWPFPEGTSYQCFPNHPNKVRRPDFSFIQLDRLSAKQALEGGHIPIVPDMAVEVVSPNDLYYEVEIKINEWMTAGVRLLWIINPQTRNVRVFLDGGSSDAVQEKDEISGEDVIVGFRCRVSDFFLMPAEINGERQAVG